ncbi:hypothetical protein [Novipirellula artificiosorum]|uniref:Uncharacterized protein n=1 Tax=Novipirellula artificiosorum TaxID=2528016 RepID=A0A5C6DWY7_9BACT|nr:hypothetical protein [Novipirellula artificiosorum]TWU39536.1 hypothetical protein Poly41_23910 [Novipirellula artificiosorum]
MSRSVMGSHPDETLDRVCLALREQQTPAFPDPDIVWPTSEEKVPRSSPVFAKTTSRRFQLAAVAATFALAVGGFWIPWNGPGNQAFAQVQDAIRKLNSVTFRLETFANNAKTASYDISFVSPDYVRAEGADDVHVLNNEASKVMDLFHSQKRAEIYPIYDLPSVSRRVLGAYGQLLQLEAQAEMEVAEKVLDGQKVLEFSTSFDGATANVIVDAETHLPIRISVDRGKDANLNSVIEVIDQFSFDETIDASLFAISAPAGYVVEATDALPPDTSTKAYAISDESGLGPAKFGASKPEVIAMFGEPDKIVTREGTKLAINGNDPNFVPDLRPGGNVRWEPADPKYTIDELQYDSRGFRLRVSSKDGLTSIHCFDTNAMGPRARKFLGATQEGIGIGSSWDEVIGAYGEPTTKLDNQAAMYRNPAFYFDFKSARVASIRVRARDAEEE